MTRLEARLSSARRREADAFAIIFLDVDGFKAVNDRCGHAAGDALLCRIANVLLTCVREGDLVARLGGDEFAILLERISNEADPHVIAGRILTEVPQLTKPTPSDPTVGVSLGIVIADSPPLDGEALMARADSALYDAKRRGKGRATVFAVAG
jgi:diguanylate cyclase (GGDEF)-like protein